jgi:FkbM family methyltransferase
MRNQIQWLKTLPFGLAIKLIAIFAVRKITGLPITFSYAQGGEDIIIAYIARNHLAMTKPGKYVDVGCNAPVRYSNTFDLYLLGWRGVNIDANSELIREGGRVRKEDIFVRAAASDIEREVTFHKGVSDLVSTIDEKKIIEWKKHFEYSEEDQEMLTTRTLTSILDDTWKPAEPIDLLTIDVEGHDFQVLKGLDLTRYRPKIIVIEMHDLDGIQDSEIYRHLIANEYQLKHFALLNAYFVDARISASV